MTNLSHILTPESDAAEIVQTFTGLPEGRTGRVPLLVSRDLERKLTVAREEIMRFRERFKLIDSMKSCSDQREESWTAVQNFDIYFEQALIQTAPKP